MHSNIVFCLFSFLENKINDLARKMEKQFAERSVRKPAGGVSILPQRNDEVQKLTVRPWRMILIGQIPLMWKAGVEMFPGFHWYGEEMSAFLVLGELFL